MSKVKKNVFQEFLQEDFVPEGNQYIVKYVAGKGNNLHSVEDIEGSTYLVSMPKKFRQTVWLKKNDCLVIDPIAEGNKVRGEINCVIPVKHVVDLIETGEWCPKTDSSDNSNPNVSFTKDSVITFFKKHLDNRDGDRDSPSEFIPTDDSESESGTDEDEDEEEEEEEEGEEENEDEEVDGVDEGAPDKAASTDANNYRNSELSTSTS